MQEIAENIKILLTNHVTVHIEVAAGLRSNLGAVMWLTFLIR